ncbi:potassium channel family protein [Sphingomonas mesophila]|uniref:potassium channel family protein n=1 Tax=Sphingomonas mesophila TaxID=2303576 RepID=UPI001F076BAA|nr:potassium channel family protein [Sphingomonas mesophila]
MAVTQGFGPDAEHMTLRRVSTLRPSIQLAIRLAILVGLLIFIVAFHWLERDSLKDNHDGHISFADIIYFTMISATTTGYGDIVPITENARLFDALVVTPIRIFFIIILAGTAYTFIIKRTWNKWLMQRIQQRLSGHIIVAGYGTTGNRAVDELIARGVSPKKLVVIDIDRDRLDCAEPLGVAVLQGDATRDATMEAVRVKQASSLIVATGRDDTSILVCLTARHFAPNLPITVAILARDNEFPARAAGATCVINPTSFAGLLLAGSAQGVGLADYLADLASVDGQVQLIERAVTPAEAGKPLQQLGTGVGLRILRKGKTIGFWEAGANTLQQGDRVIEIVANRA